MAPADYAVVLTSGALTGADATRRTAPLVDLAAALDAAGSGAVVAGTPDAAGAGGLVAAVRDDPAVSVAVSTVDDVGTTAGRVSTVLALPAGARRETSGRYGTGSDAQPARPGPARRREHRPPPAAGLTGALDGRVALAAVEQLGRRPVHRPVAAARPRRPAGHAARRPGGRRGRHPHRRPRRPARRPGRRARHRCPPGAGRPLRRPRRRAARRRPRTRGWPATCGRCAPGGCRPAR